MQRDTNQRRHTQFVTRLLGAATVAALALAGSPAHAAERGSAMPRSGASQQFRAAPDFHDVASRTDARFASQTGNVPAAVTACLAGCYNGAGTGLIEVRVHAYEVLTSASFAPEPPTAPLVRTAINDGVQCVAGCSTLAAARTTGRIELLPAFDAGHALAQFAPGQRHRSISRFALTGPKPGHRAGTLTQHRTAALSRPVRTAIR